MGTSANNPHRQQNYKTWVLGYQNKLILKKN